MKSTTTQLPSDLQKVAQKVVWFKSPQETLKDSVDFVHALQYAYPGIMDQRSWAYWNLIYQNDPFKKLPERQL